jgi:hypothetical protein
MSAVPPWLIFSPRDPRIAVPPAGHDQTPTAGKRERSVDLPAAMIVACPEPQRLPESRSARFETSPVEAYRVFSCAAEFGRHWGIAL